MTQSKQHVSLPSLLVREFNLMAVPIRNSNVCASSRRVLRTKTTSSPSPLAPRSAYPSTPNFTGMRNPSFALSLAFLEVLQLPVKSFCRDCTFGKIVGSSTSAPRVRILVNPAYEEPCQAPLRTGFTALPVPVPRFVGRTECNNNTRIQTCSYNNDCSALRCRVTRR